jgi:hypothetical protein
VFEFESLLFIWKAASEQKSTSTLLLLLGIILGDQQLAALQKKSTALFAQIRREL